MRQPKRFYEFGPFRNRQISTLRKALGETSDEPKYVETIPKVGYRLVAPVREIRDQGADMVIERHTIARIVTEEDADLIAQLAAPAAAQGYFVTAVDHLTYQWVQAGLILDKQKGAIMRAAARFRIA